MDTPKNFSPLRTPVASIHEVSFRPRNMIDYASDRKVASETVSSVETRSQTTSLEEVPQPKQRQFKSARLIGEYEKPWLKDRSYRLRERFDKVILGICAIIGLALAGFLCWREWAALPEHDYCLVLDDNFQTLNTSAWSHEIGIGGYGYGSFDWTTDDPANSYTSSDGLHIVPTLTVDTTNITANQILNGYVLNLTTDGTCTSPADIQCARRSNITDGTIINPVRSARLTTAGKVAIKYGRVEIVAKMPKGDWLWPSLWMYPENETYGAWPRSGEMDISWVRGNDAATYPSGRDTLQSALHWGPSSNLDQSARTTGKLLLRRTDLAADFHTYGIEWSENYLFTWIDDRVWEPLKVKFGPENLYQRGGFPDMWINGQLPPNIWSETGLANTPFDQPFHLILNVAVGASNGFFPDSVGSKPWIDGSPTSMLNFWKANATWLPTWGLGADRGMTVKSVKMWQQGKC